MTESETNRSGESVAELRARAEGGDAKAQCNLGDIYADGKGVPKHSDRAFYWYRVAADRGHAKAQFRLGVMYAKGECVRQNVTKAER